VNEHRNARLWIAFAAVAAIALLVVGPRLYRQWGGSRAPSPSHDDVADAPLGDKRAASTVGRAVGAPPKNDGVGMPASAPDQQTAPDQEEARELLKKSFTAAQFSPHRLEWEPEEVTLSNTVLDLCNDEQAAQAGLQAGALDDTRYSSVACARSSSSMFSVVRICIMLAS